MPTLLTKAIRLIAGRDSGANDLIAKLTDAGVVCVKLYGLDTETTHADVEIATDAQGRLKSSGVLTAHVDEVETKLDTVIGHVDGLETKLDTLASHAANTYWQDMRIDDTSGNIDYVGRNTTHKAAEAATTWYIWKYSDYNGSRPRRKEGPLVGSWTGRAALAWAT